MASIHPVATAIFIRHLSGLTSFYSRSISLSFVYISVFFGRSGFKICPTPYTRNPLLCSSPAAIPILKVSRVWNGAFNPRLYYFGLRWFSDLLSRSMVCDVCFTNWSWGSLTLCVTLSLILCTKAYISCNPPSASSSLSTIYSKKLYVE